ncbi:MAG: hypothetical protein MUC42_00770 [Bryobacter sp.]|nr:hypothetical protein [Bryobacter sp.]
MTPIASPIQIACAADHRYALPTAVMLRSLADHLPDQRSAVVHLLDDGISPDDRDRIRETSPA